LACTLARVDSQSVQQTVGRTPIWQMPRGLVQTVSRHRLPLSPTVWCHGLAPRFVPGSDSASDFQSANNNFRCEILLEIAQIWLDFSAVLQRSWVRHGKLGARGI